MQSTRVSTPTQPNWKWGHPSTSRSHNHNCGRTHSGGPSKVPWAGMRWGTRRASKCSGASGALVLRRSGRGRRLRARRSLPPRTPAPPVAPPDPPRGGNRACLATTCAPGDQAAAGLRHLCHRHRRHCQILSSQRVHLRHCLAAAAHLRASHTPMPTCPMARTLGMVLHWIRPSAE